MAPPGALASGSIGRHALAGVSGCARAAGCLAGSAHMHECMHEFSCMHSCLIACLLQQLTASASSTARRPLHQLQDVLARPPPLFIHRPSPSPLTPPMPPPRLHVIAADTKTPCFVFDLVETLPLRELQQVRSCTCMHVMFDVCVGGAGPDCAQAGCTLHPSHA